MGLLDELLGGGQRQAEYKDFANRYQQGSPYDTIGDEETLQRYKELAPELSDDRLSATPRGSRSTSSRRRSGRTSAAGSASGRSSRASRCRTTT